MASQMHAKDDKQRATSHRKPGPEARSERKGEANLQRAISTPQQAAPSDLLALQRAGGNRAVSRLVQGKLKVGPAGDQYEQEADRVAEQVVGGGGPDVQQVEDEEEIQTKSLAASISRLVQREAAPEEEEIQTQPLVQRRGEGGFEAGGEIEQELDATRGGGQPLSEGVRAYMEPRFGADFGGVRLHRGDRAAEMNRDLGAQAFTHGSHIYLGEGKNDTASPAGKRLLAHELTHVVQQGGAGVRKQDDPEVERASATSPRIQRALDFEGTKWSDTKAVRWVKGQDHPDHDNVLLFEGAKATKLWVKTDESVSQAGAAAALLNSAGRFRGTKAGAPGEPPRWQIATPQIRTATPADRAGMVKKITRWKLSPKSSSEERATLKAVLHDTAKPVQIATHAGGEMGDAEIAESQEPWRADPGFRKSLGYTALLDIILGNFDRTIGYLGPQNWKVERPNATLHLIDNLQRGVGLEIPFEVWRQNQWVQQARARDWAGIKTRLNGNWMTDPQWALIPHPEKNAWFNDFVGGMQEAWGDLDAIQQNFRASAGNSPEVGQLMQRIDYVRGWKKAVKKGWVAGVIPQAGSDDSSS